MSRYFTPRRLRPLLHSSGAVHDGSRVVLADTAAGALRRHRAIFEVRPRRDQPGRPTVRGRRRAAVCAENRVPLRRATRGREHCKSCAKKPARGPARCHRTRSSALGPCRLVCAPAPAASARRSARRPGRWPFPARRANEVVRQFIACGMPARPRRGPGDATRRESRGPRVASPAATRRPVRIP